jgi:hypothetical protein
MAKKKKGPRRKVTKAAGPWEITEAGNVKKHPWAAGLPVGAAFSIVEDADGTITFVAEKNCAGIFKDARKRMADLSAGLGKLRSFHDGKEVTSDSFRLAAILDRKAFVFSGFRKKSNRGTAHDAGSIEIYSVGAALLATLKNRRATVQTIQHGGPHGEPRKLRILPIPGEPEPHKLVGRWRILEEGGPSYPWSAGLPKGARFEITPDLRFVPGPGCTGKFARTRKLSRPPAAWSETPHHDDHDHPPSNGNDDRLLMKLDNKTEITLTGDHQGVQKIWFQGPPGLSIKSHGGPHGEPD